MAKVMARSINTNIAEDIKAEAFITHLHTPHTTKALTQHVIIDHKTFKAEAISEASFRQPHKPYLVLTKPAITSVEPFS